MMDDVDDRIEWTWTIIDNSFEPRWIHGFFEPLWTSMIIHDQPTANLEISELRGGAHVLRSALPVTLSERSFRKSK